MNKKEGPKNFTKKFYLNLDPKDTQTQILGTLGIKKGFKSELGLNRIY